MSVGYFFVDKSNIPLYYFNMVNNNKTILTINNEKFLINEKLTYSEIKDCHEQYHGLLMNSRMIQGIFDDKQDVSRFNRFGKDFNPDVNTNEFIEALPQWYEKGLRAVTVGFQGGGPCFTIDNYTIENNPYSADGKIIDSAYLDRMKKVIQAADQIGMIVIVSFFYGSQCRFFRDDLAIMQAVKTASNWLRDEQFTNIIIEIANEHDVPCFKRNPIIYLEDSVVELMEIAKRESGGIPVGCSGMGGTFHEKIIMESDVVLIHGNGLTRQHFYNLIQKVKKIKPNTPIVCNEDSQAFSNMIVAMKAGTSWGYYNNLTKQEPPVYWEITKGEDDFFTTRLALELGIEQTEPSLEDQFYLQGFENHMTYENKRWIRVASLYPEKIDYVDFFRDGKLFATAYDDPFSIYFNTNWIQDAVENIQPSEKWIAKIHLLDGTIISKTN